MCFQKHIQSFLLEAVSKLNFHYKRLQFFLKKTIKKTLS